MKIKKNRPASRGVWLLILGILVVGLLGVYFFRPFSRQPSESKAEKTEKEIRPPAPEVWFGRKEIYDRRFKKLAVSFQLSSIYARPLEMPAAEKAVQQLAPVLGWDEHELLLALKSERSFVWLARHVPAEMTERLANLNIQGVAIVEEIERYYPQQKSAAHVIGFLREDQGLAGVEYYYDAILRGGAPSAVPADKKTEMDQESFKRPGAHLVLTLDLPLQEYLETSLEKLAKKTEATTAVAIVMDPNSGAILGLANLPAFDPNRFWDFSEEILRNRAVAANTPLGGISSYFLVAAALEGKALSLEEISAQVAMAGDQKTPGTEVQGRDGSGASGEELNWIKIGEGIYGRREAARLKIPELGVERVRGFGKLLGFYGPSEIDLPEEPFSDKMSAFTLDDPLSVTTPIHILDAFARILNGGVAITPHVLDSFWYDGTRERIAAPVAEKIPAFTPELAFAIQKALVQAAGPVAGGPLILESLSVDEPGREAKGDGPAAKKETAAPETGATEPKQGGGAERYQALSLTAVPAEKPEIVFLILLEGKHFDRKSPSLLRMAAQEMAPKLMVRLVSRKSGITAEKGPEQNDYEAIFQQWSGSQRDNVEGGRLLRTQPEGPMPKVIGLSLRRALQTLQPLDLQVRIEGSGAVVDQRPPAGASIEGGEVKLFLKDTLKQ